MKFLMSEDHDVQSFAGAPCTSVVSGLCQWYALFPPDGKGAGEHHNRVEFTHGWYESDKIYNFVISYSVQDK